MDYFDHPHGRKDKPDGYGPIPTEFRVSDGQRNLIGRNIIVWQRYSHQSSGQEGRWRLAKVLSFKLVDGRKAFTIRFDYDHTESVQGPGVELWTWCLWGMESLPKPSSAVVMPTPAAAGRAAGKGSAATSNTSVRSQGGDSASPDVFGADANTAKKAKRKGSGTVMERFERQSAAAARDRMSQWSQPDSGAAGSAGGSFGRSNLDDESDYGDGDAGGKPGGDAGGAEVDADDDDSDDDDDLNTATIATATKQTPWHDPEMPIGSNVGNPQGQQTIALLAILEGLPVGVLRLVWTPSANEQAVKGPHASPHGPQRGVGGEFL